jgi:hypothetical protein
MARNARKQASCTTSSAVGAVAGDPAGQRVGIAEMGQHQSGEARVVVLAGRHVVLAIYWRFLIKTLAGTIVQASLGLDRIAAAKAYYGHSPFLGIKLVDSMISHDDPAPWRSHNIAVGRHFDGPATPLVAETRNVPGLDDPTGRRQD